uniref:Calmodulin-lysine N-methyltransferase n=1 Tax=Odontella aurita TaxID=265563 RepID=A0A7S4J5J0_9STRA|mmetsp:Transcript_39087/g.117502  ORF Transcript_39087/g.117502 Transcript_39087/m.117502 type:complete len:455 (+) Transcript_39087:235-1599(+)
MSAAGISADAGNRDPPPRPPTATRPPHPVASAFFRSLDDKLNGPGAGDGDSSSSDDDVADRSPNGSGSAFPPPDSLSPPAAVPRQRKMDPALLRKAQSLGWRNRHSQAEFYPVSMELPPTRLSDPRGDGATEATSNAASPHRRIRRRRAEFSVRQVQRGETENTYGTGATVWPASMVLLKYMEALQPTTGGRGSGDTCSDNEAGEGGPPFSSSSPFEGKTVADLGAGTGVTSVAAAALGASLVVCTDGCDLVVELAEQNARRACGELAGGCLGEEVRGSLADSGGEGPDELGGGRFTGSTSSTSSAKGGNETGEKMTIGQCELRVRKYWWGEDDESMLQELADECNNSRDSLRIEASMQNQRYYDYLLVSDCVLPKLYPIGPLVGAISRLTGPETITYLSYEHRYYPAFDPKEEFSRLAEEEGLEVRVVPQKDHHPIYSVDDIEVWEVRRRQEP